jgi:hypothetical protein
MPIQIHPGKLSFTKRSRYNLWKEQYSVIPIIPSPNGKKRIIEKRMLKVADKIVFTDTIPVRLTDFDT